LTVFNTFFVDGVQHIHCWRCSTHSLLTVFNTFFVDGVQRILCWRCSMHSLLTVFNTFECNSDSLFLAVGLNYSRELIFWGGNFGLTYSVSNDEPNGAFEFHF